VTAGIISNPGLSLQCPMLREERHNFYRDILFKDQKDFVALVLGIGEMGN
jgi:hypothetical protein